jgi:REP element-mobilizing transposase RayT
MNFKPSAYTRRLPHFDIGQVYYHLVFRLKEGCLNEDEIVLVKQHIVAGDGQFYRLIAVQVMANHVHMVVQPNEGVKILAVVRGTKGATARRINLLRGTTGSLWSDKYYDRIIRNEDDFEKTLKYLEHNPVKAGVTEEGWNYGGWKFVQK